MTFPLDRSQLGFIAVVRKEFSFLVEYGFRCVKEELTLIQFESENIMIDIYHDASSFEIGLKFGLLGASESYSLSELIRLIEGNHSQIGTDFVALSPESMKRGGELLSKSFRHYAHYIFENNLSLFERLEEQKARWTQEEAKKTYANNIRLKAGDALF